MSLRTVFSQVNINLWSYPADVVRFYKESVVPAMLRSPGLARRRTRLYTRDSLPKEKA